MPGLFWAFPCFVACLGAAGPGASPPRRLQDGKDDEWTCVDGVWYGPDGEIYQYPCDGADDSYSCTTQDMGDATQGWLADATKVCIDHASAPGGRCFWFYVPAAVAAATDGRKVPLVVDMHGGGGCAADQARFSGWREQADSAAEAGEGMVVVWPQAVVIGGESGGSWNDCGAVATSHEQQNLAAAGSFSGKEACTGADDVSFLEQGIAVLVAGGTGVVDAERVIVSGFSLGCMMAHRFALERSRLVAVLTCQGGELSLVETSDPTLMETFRTTYDVQPMPVFNVCGTWDIFCATLGLEDYRFWAFLSGCTQSSTEQDTSAYVVHRSTSCAAYSPALELVYLEVVGGTHATDTAVVPRTWAFAQRYRRAGAMDALPVLPGQTPENVTMTTTRTTILADDETTTTCGEVQAAYRASNCCGNPSQMLEAYGMTCGDVRELYRDSGCCGFPSRPIAMPPRPPGRV